MKLIRLQKSAMPLDDAAKVLRLLGAICLGHFVAGFGFSAALLTLMSIGSGKYSTLLGMFIPFSMLFSIFMIPTTMVLLPVIILFAIYFRADRSMCMLVGAVIGGVLGLPALSVAIMLVEIGSGHPGSAAFSILKPSAVTLLFGAFAAIAGCLFGLVLWARFFKMEFDIGKSQ